jgi:hypothetical protein
MRYRFGSLVGLLSFRGQSRRTVFPSQALLSFLPSLCMHPYRRWLYLSYAAQNCTRMSAPHRGERLPTRLASIDRIDSDMQRPQLRNPFFLKICSENAQRSPNARRRNHARQKIKSCMRKSKGRVYIHSLANKVDR